MTKHLFLATTLCFLIVNSIAQSLNTGTSGYNIKFESGLSWKEILGKARKAKKFIFVDCYATWCGPCKFMSQKIFTLPNVANFFNDHFINVQIQMNRTSSDSDNIKSWYSDADNINSLYGIEMYPTYLIFSPQGEALHRIVGAFSDGSQFISKISEAFDEYKQFYSIIRDYKSHRHDSVYLRNAVITCMANGDKADASKIADVYIETAIQDTFSKSNLELMRQNMYTSEDKSFTLFLSNTSAVDKRLGNNAAENCLRRVITQEEITPLLNTGKSINWNKIKTKISIKYPLYADRIVQAAKIEYYNKKMEWPQFEKASLEYLNSYGEQLSNFEMNNLCWNIFLHANKVETLSEALKWSSQTVLNYPNVGDWAFVDTYAGLLYKAGQKEKSIEWEIKAIAIAADEKQRKEMESTLVKMLNGEDLVHKTNE